MGLQQTLKALADPIRRDILNLLKNGRMSAGEITSHFSVTAASISRHLSVLKEADLVRDTREGQFSVTAASISRHLSVLKEADLVRDTREGQFIFYELNASVLEEIMLWITDLKGEISYDKKE